jgi:hypothetical protein
MPSEELLDAVRQSTLRPSFSNSRDYKGPNFQSYINPNFYRGEMPAWQGFVVRDQLRQNNEIYAFNEPHITEFELRGFQVSPVIPTGIYKKNTIARVYYWKDGQQIMKRYRLISLDDVNPQQITDQVFQNFLSSMVEWSAEFWGSKFMNAITFGIGKPVSEGLNILKREIDGSDVYGVWVQEGSLTENLSTVTGRAPAVGLLDSMQLDNQTISEQASTSGSPLPLLLAGVGLVTGNLWLSGIGLLLRLRR